MCFPKAPKIPAPQPLPERQIEKPPSDAAIMQNTTERTKRRLGYANLQFTPVAGLAPAVTTGKTLLGM
jgi:hypothetical protein